MNGRSDAMNGLARLGWCTALLALAPCIAWAQGTAAASIAGVVRDPSGAVLPGVTVEASSPVLIEKVRTTVTDHEGQFRIIELRPGAYKVSFALQGFNTHVRDGLQLAPSFTATITVEMTVGTLEETVTVSGASPLVDVQNLTQQKTISKDVIDAVPTAKSMLGIAALMPSVVTPPGAQDVGGTKGERSVRISVHGGKTTDQRLLQDGMRYNALTAGALEGTGRGYYPNPLEAQEIVIDVGTMGSAEYGLGGAQINTIPRDGGNRFSASFFTAWTGHQLQGENLTDDLRAQGLTSVNGVRKVYDVNLAVGGPLIKDRLWFFTAHRRWGTTTRVANLYEDANLDDFIFTPDLDRPVDPIENDKHHGGRLTWQISQRHKLAFYYGWQKNLQEQLTGQLERGNLTREANAAYCQRQDLSQVTWTHPRSSQLLLEGGVTISRFDFGNFGTDLSLADFTPCGFGRIDRVSINDTTLGLTYNGVGNRTLSKSHQTNGRFTVSYIAGDHNLKAGLFYMYGLGGGHRTRTERTPSQIDGLPLAYTFNNGVPTSITQYATPLYTADQLNPDLGLFVQDQWRVGRLTINAGLRFDWVHQSVPPLSVEAGPLVPARSFDAVDDVPNWKDLSPRLGVAWDPFADGKTAIKVGLNRYVSSAVTGVANLFDPVNSSVNSTTRAWADSNGNFLPDCDLRSPTTNGECGAMANAAFGQLRITTNPDPDWVTGWGKRGYNWQASISIDREVMPNVAVQAGYYRTWFGNFSVTDNLAVTPADFSPYCITAPGDSRLPSGISGQQMCGFYDINPSVFGQVNNLVTLADSYGKQTEVYNGGDVNVTARVRGVTLNGGWNVGTAIQTGLVAGGATQSRTDSCFVVDSPQQLYNCKAANPFQHRIKLAASYAMKWDIQLAAVYQNVPGINYGATYTATTAEIASSLGRPLSGNVRTVSLELLPLFSAFGPRINQLDLRVSKIFRIAGGKIQGNFDIYNVANAATPLSYNNTYGPRWLQPTQILDARLAKVSVQIDF